MDSTSEDMAFMKVVGSTVVKSIFFICLTVGFCFSLSNCSLKESTIQNCESSCDKSGTRMEYVTHSKCQCADQQSITPNSQKNEWVLPRK
jgi:hypothetical protein|tara:strand:+ start:445 stop:714 length:270 start_codon:yes stop_codon:yes gene_type:complete